MRKCYILGAGASYGYDESLFVEQRMPITDEFFLKGEKMGLLNPDVFPELVQYLESYIKETRKDKQITSYTCDVEDFLQWLCEGFDKAETDKSSKQRALGQCYFYIYELLRRLCSLYYPKYDNYRRLALHFHDNRYSVITLNYDVLFEMAANSIGINCYYSDNPNRPLNSILLLKLHGSINWINQLGRAIAYGGEYSDLFPVIAQNIYSNRFQIGDIKILPTHEIRGISFRDLILSGDDYYEPVIIPPFSNYKDFDKVDFYKKVWDAAKKQIDRAQEIIIIGCSIRPQDLKLIELMKDIVDDKKVVTICSPDAEIVKQRIQNIEKARLVNEYRTFTEYARTL